MERTASNVIGAIYEAAEEEDCWSVLYEVLRRSVRMDYADFVIGHRSIEPVKSSTNDIVRFRHGWFEVQQRTAFEDREGMLRGYMETFATLDPLAVDMDEHLSRFVELPIVNADGTIGPGRSDTDWTNTTYFNDFMKPHKVENPARFITSISPSEQLVANVNWGVPYDCVTAEERRLVNLGVSHAARILDHKKREAPILGGVETLLRTLDMVDEAAFVLDRDLNVETLNRAARDLLETDIVVELHAGRLRLADGEAEQAIRQSFATPSPFVGQSDFLIGSIVGPKSLRARVSPVADRDDGRNGAGSRFLLLIDARNAARMGRLVMRAVLTLRERHAMLALASLGSEREAAKALGISYNTFRTHRRTSYSKLAIASRSELLKLLNS